MTQKFDRLALTFRSIFKQTYITHILPVSLWIYLFILSISTNLLTNIAISLSVYFNVLIFIEVSLFSNIFQSIFIHLSIYLSKGYWKNSKPYTERRAITEHLFQGNTLPLLDKLIQISVLISVKPIQMWEVWGKIKTKRLNSLRLCWFPCGWVVESWIGISVS